MDVRVGLTVALVTMVLLGAVPVATADAGDATVESAAVQEADLDADEIRMDVAVQPDGTAEWTLEFWVHLDDDERTEAFESLEADVAEDPDGHVTTVADRMDGTVAAASEATGREMAADGYAVETERQSFADEYGVLRYTFEWHGFAAAEGDELHAGDAIEGLYLDDGTRLLLSWPAEYTPTTIAPDPDDSRETAAIWRGGETDFVSGEPRVVLAPDATGPSTALVGGVAALLVGFGVAGAWWYRTRDAPLERSIPGRSAATDAPDDGSAGPDAPGDEPRADTDDGGADAAGARDEAVGGASPAGSPDPALLSNEEQVLQVVREHGGRVKQQTVAAELDWTDAKTSKVVSGLRDDGDLESFRLGRENVLSLPGESVLENDGDGGDGDAGDDGGDDSS